MNLFKRIFDEEFDIGIFMEAGIIKAHFMLHSKSVLRILPSLNNHLFSLLYGMFCGNFKGHTEPINLIYAYYGEKLAFYFAFLIHLVSWLIIPSTLSFCFFLYTMYKTFTMEVEPYAEGDNDYFV